MQQSIWLNWSIYSCITSIMVLRGHKKIFSTIVNSSVWTNNQINMRPINRIKWPNLWCICTYRDSIRTGGPRTHWAIEVYIPQESEAGVWDFKGKAGNSQVEEKEQTCGEQFLTESPKTMGPRGESYRQTLLDPPVWHT